MLRLRTLVTPTLITLSICLSVGSSTKADEEQAKQTKSSWALCIVKGNYGLEGKLRGAADRASRLKVSLEKAGFQEDQITILADDPDGATDYPPPTIENVRWSAKRIVERAGRDDRIFCFLNAHGELGAVVLDAGERLNLQWLHDELAMSKAKQIFFVVDSCRVLSGQHKPGPDHHDGEDVTCIWFYACRAGQLAYGCRFSTAVAEGLSGSADADKNGRITADELFQFAKDQIPGHWQTPVMEVRSGRAAMVLHVLHQRPNPEPTQPRNVKPVVQVSKSVYCGVRCRHGCRHVHVHADGVLPTHKGQWVYLIASVHHADRNRTTHRTADGLPAQLVQWVRVGEDGRVKTVVTLPPHLVNNPWERYPLTVKLAAYERNHGQRGLPIIRELATAGYHRIQSAWFVSCK